MSGRYYRPELPAAPSNPSNPAYQPLPNDPPMRNDLGRDMREYSRHRPPRNVDEGAYPFMDERYGRERGRGPRVGGGGGPDSQRHRLNSRLHEVMPPAPSPGLRRPPFPQAVPPSNPNVATASVPQPLQDLLSQLAATGTLPGVMDPHSPLSHHPPQYGQPPLPHLFGGYPPPPQYQHPPNPYQAPVPFSRRDRDPSTWHQGASLNDRGPASRSSSAIDDLSTARVEKPSRTLFVRNVFYGTKLEDLKADFGVFGDIKDLFSLVEHRGIVFVTYYDIRASEKAKEVLQNKEIHGRKIDVHFSLPKQDSGVEGKCDGTKNQGTLFMVVTDPSKNASNSEYYDVFKAYGDVKAVRDLRDRKDQKFVEFFDSRACISAWEATRSGVINGIRVDVQYAWDKNTKLNREQALGLRRSDRAYRPDERPSREGSAASSRRTEPDMWPPVQWKDVGREPCLPDRPDTGKRVRDEFRPGEDRAREDRSGAFERDRREKRRRVDSPDRHYRPEPIPLSERPSGPYEGGWAGVQGHRPAPSSQPIVDSQNLLKALASIAPVMRNPNTSNQLSPTEVLGQLNLAALLQAANGNNNSNGSDVLRDSRNDNLSGKSQAQQPMQPPDMMFPGARDIGMTGFPPNVPSSDGPPPLHWPRDANLMSKLPPKSATSNSPTASELQKQGGGGNLSGRLDRRSGYPSADDAHRTNTYDSASPTSATSTSQSYVPLPPDVQKQIQKLASTLMSAQNKDGPLTSSRQQQRPDRDGWGYDPGTPNGASHRPSGHPPHPWGS